MQDDATKCNRIIFDDDFDEQQNCKPRKEKKKNLFDDDDGNGNNDNEDSLWDENDFSVKKSVCINSVPTLCHILSFLKINVFY